MLIASIGQPQEGQRVHTLLSDISRPQSGHFIFPILIKDVLIDADKDVREFEQFLLFQFYKE